MMCYESEDECTRQVVTVILDQDNSPTPLVEHMRVNTSITQTPHGVGGTPTPMTGIENTDNGEDVPIHYSHVQVKRRYFCPWYP